MDEPWVTAASASGMVEANIMRGRLEAEGIPVRLQYDAACTIYALTVDGIGEVKLLVPETLRGEAVKVLGQSFTEQDLDWAR